MPSTTPADVLARRRRLILSGDADGYADLFAPDGVIESPFAPAGAPSRLEGREAIREYSRRVMAAPVRLENLEEVELYRTQDPEVAIVEVRATATFTTTGRSFATTSIQIYRIRDGQIVLFRDFANSRVLEEAVREARPEAEAPPQSRRGAMFARVITARAGAGGFDGTIRLFEQQLPGARQQPGFKGYYLLTDAETGKLVIISLWETREQMDEVTAGAGPSGIRDQHNPAARLTDMHLETYEVTMHI